MGAFRTKTIERANRAEAEKSKAHPREPEETPVTDFIVGAATGIPISLTVPAILGVAYHLSSSSARDTPSSSDSSSSSSDSSGGGSEE
jgi:hypothetical protein